MRPIQANPPAGVVIWRPGGVSAGNVRTSSSAAFAAANAAGLGTQLWVDDTIAAAVMDPGAHDMTGISSIVGANEFTPATVTVDPLTTFSWTNYWGMILINVGLAFDGSVTSPVEVPADGLYLGLDMYASISCGLASAVPFFHVSGTSSLFADVGLGSKLIGSAGHQVIKLDTGGPTCTLKFASQSELRPNTVTGGDSGAFTIIDGSATTAPTSTAMVSLSQAGITAPVVIYGFGS